MARAPVSDLPSNFNEQIDYFARHLTGSQQQKLFEEICKGHKKPKYVSDLAATTKLSNIRVSQICAKLADIGFVEKGRAQNPKTRKTENYYQRIPEVAAHRSKILKYARDPSLLNNLPTKRNPIRSTSTSGIVNISFRAPKNQVKVSQLFIDDIDSFGLTRGKETSKTRLEMSEDTFKNGVQSLIGEPGEFKDWGGEKSDLYSTRVKYKGSRISAAFAFKGPGVRGKLKISSMGKNGDQAIRLFQEPAKLFVVQHWREIDPVVIELINQLAIAKSITSGKEIFFCIIDGKDSCRIVEAYKTHFT